MKRLLTIAALIVLLSGCAGYRTVQMKAGDGWAPPPMVEVTIGGCSFVVPIKGLDNPLSLAWHGFAVIGAGTLVGATGCVGRGWGADCPGFWRRGCMARRASVTILFLPSRPVAVSLRGRRRVSGASGGRREVAACWCLPAMAVRRPAHDRKPRVHLFRQAAEVWSRVGRRRSRRRSGRGELRQA